MNRLDEETKQLLTSADALLGLAALGEIAGDLRESDQRAAGVMHRSDDGVGPESLAVLADPPPFIFYSAFGSGCFELSRRPLGRNVVLGVKNRKDPPDHFLFRIAEDPRRPTIPGANAAVRFEEEEGVVLDRFDEQRQLVGRRQAATILVHHVVLALCMALAHSDRLRPSTSLSRC